MPVLRDGDRLPVDAEGGRHRGRRSVRRRRVLHQPLAARGRRLHREAGRRHRHRLVGGPVHPAHRRAGRGADRVPAHPGLLGPRAQRSPSAGSSRGNRGRPRGVPRCGEAFARGHPCGAARAHRGDVFRGGAPRSFRGRIRGRRALRHPRHLRRPGGQPRVQRDRRRDDPGEGSVDRDRPRDRRVAVREGLLLRHQAAVSRHGLLRDLQPPARPSGRPAQGPDQDHHRDRHRHGRRLTRVRCDRLRDRIRRDDGRAGLSRHHRP